VLYDETVDEKEPDRIASAGDSSTVPVRDVNAYREVTLGVLNPEMFKLLPLLLDGLSDMSGITQLSRGTMSPKSHVPNSALQNIENNGDALFDDHSLQLKRFAQEIATDVLCILREFKDLPDTVYDAQKQEFVQWNRDKLNPYMQVDIELGADVEKSAEQQQNMWAQLGQTLPVLYKTLAAGGLPPQLVAQLLAGLLQSYHIRGADRIVSALSQQANQPQPPQGGQGQGGAMPQGQLSAPGQGQRQPQPMGQTQGV
jgi:hypothetical protein